MIILEQPAVSVHKIKRQIRFIRFHIVGKQASCSNWEGSITKHNPAQIAKYFTEERREENPKGCDATQTPHSQKDNGSVKKTTVSLKN